MLEEYTTKELVVELAKRHDAVVMLLYQDRTKKSSTRQIVMTGDSVLCLGLCSVLQAVALDRDAKTRTGGEEDSEVVER